MERALHLRHIQSLRALLYFPPGCDALPVLPSSNNSSFSVNASISPPAHQVSLSLEICFASIFIQYVYSLTATNAEIIS